MARRSYFEGVQVSCFSWKLPTNLNTCPYVISWGSSVKNSCLFSPICVFNSVIYLHQYRHLDMDLVLWVRLHYSHYLFCCPPYPSFGRREHCLFQVGSCVLLTCLCLFLFWAFPPFHFEVHFDRLFCILKTCYTSKSQLGSRQVVGSQQPHPAEGLLPASHWACRLSPWLGTRFKCGHGAAKLISFGPYWGFLKWKHRIRGEVSTYISTYICVCIYSVLHIIWSLQVAHDRALFHSFFVLQIHSA